MSSDSLAGQFLLNQGSDSVENVPFLRKSDDDQLKVYRYYDIGSYNVRQ